MAVPRLVDGILYREGTIRDYDGVINIVGDLHGGNDYLPWFYRVAAHTKDYHLFVGVADGQVISFSGCLIDKEGDALSSFGSRTSPNWEGKGVMANVKEYMHNFIRARYPSIKVETTDAWIGTQLIPILPKMMKKGYREETRNIVAVIYEADSAKLKKHLNRAVHITSSGTPIEFPGLRKLHQENGRLVGYLRKFGTYFAPARLWAPLAVTPGNVRLTCFLDDTRVSYNDKTHGEITGVSFQNIHPVSDGYRVNTSVYANTEDEAMLHITAWMNHLLDIIPGKNFVWSPMLTFRKQPDYRGIADRLENIIGKRVITRDDDPVDAIMMTRNILE